MSIIVHNNSKISFKGFYQSQILKKGLEFAASNSALFVAGTSLALSSVARPAAILATPKTDKENKKIACAKSISSSFVGYLVTFLVSMPISKAIMKIDDSPKLFLKKSTIAKMEENGLELSKSKAYKFSTQIFKFGTGGVAAFPKAILTCALIPVILAKIFPKKEKTDKYKKNNEYKNVAQPSFLGNLNCSNSIAKKIGKLIDTPFIQEITQKFKDTNFPMHFTVLTDTLSTWLFIHQTKKSRKIEESRKKSLIYNSAISTGLCIVGGYICDKLLKKPTEKFIKNFSEANKNSEKLDKYIEGIKIAKPTLILGGIYYIIIPIISTFFADRATKKAHL